MWSGRNYHLLLVRMQNGIDTVKDGLAVSHSTNILFPYNPVIVLLAIYPNKLKIYAHTKSCTQKFIAALLIIAKTWKQQRRLSISERTANI